MLQLEAIADEVDDASPPPVCITGVSGQVSFTGKMKGSLYQNFSEKLARSCASRILGTDKLADMEINDVIGELTNMVTGNLKSKMADKGFNCTLSIPTVIRGDKISIDSHDASISLHNLFRITELNEVLVVQVFARLEEKPL
jgi:chemotaxis protein CheX